MPKIVYAVFKEDCNYEEPDDCFVGVFSTVEAVRSYIAKDAKQSIKFGCYDRNFNKEKKAWTIDTGTYIVREVDLIEES